MIHVVTAYIVMAYIVMAYIVMAYIVMAFMVMLETTGPDRSRPTERSMALKIDWPDLAVAGRWLCNIPLRR